MLLNQLYRYILGDWDKLSSKEIKAIPGFFQKFIKNSNLPSALHALKAEKLYEKLYGKGQKGGFYYVPGDAAIEQSFNSYENDYHYFHGQDRQALLKVYKALYSLCNLAESLSNTNGSAFASANENAYKILVLFGGENNIENALTLFDQHCHKKNFQFGQESLKRVFDCQLRQGEKKINLAAWQKIIQENGFDRVERLFYMASELETRLGHAPASFAEADAAALSVIYVQQSQHPDFAAFCVSNYILEALFNQCIGEDKQQRANASYFILKQLAMEKIPEFIRHLFVLGLDFDGLCSLLESLNEEQQLFIIDQFKDYLIVNMETDDNFGRFLDLCATFKVQQQFVGILSEEQINSSIKSVSSLQKIIEAIPVDSRNEFIFFCIKGAVNKLLDNNQDYRDFLKVNLSDSEQVAYLRELFGAEKISDFAENSTCLIEQVKCICPKEQCSYVSTFFSQKKLQELLAHNYSALQELLQCVPPLDRGTLMFDVIGIDEIRKIMATPQSQYAISALLPVEQQQLFLDALPTEDEKSAKVRLFEIKREIETSNFTIGILGTGWGGREISLDDGTTKLVPRTVSKHWKLIKQAEAGQLNYADAWEQVEKLALEVKPSSGSLTLFRAAGTEAYYKRFKEAKDPEQLLTL